MRRAAGVIVLLLAGCSDPSAPERADEQAGALLEKVAVARGVVEAPAAADPVGLYARGRDQLCVVEQDAGYRVGVTVNYDPATWCSARGTAERSGERLTLRFGDNCSIPARLDGAQVAFPGSIADGCAAFCRGRASLAGFEARRMSSSASEAQAFRDPRGTALCEAG